MFWTKKRHWWAWFFYHLDFWELKFKQAEWPINLSEAAISPFKICKRRTEQAFSGPVPGTAGTELSSGIPIVATWENLSFYMEKDDDLL